MDYSEILHALQQASLFDLFRLRLGIDTMLEQSERLLPIKRALRPGMRISYFSARDNRQLDADVEEIHQINVTIRNVAGGQRWSIPLYAINLDGVNTDIHPRKGESRLDRNQLKVGDAVGFHDRGHRERYGKVLQLNPKTVSLRTADGVRWRVAYSLLFKVMEGDGHHEPEPGLIEGEILEG